MFASHEIVADMERNRKEGIALLSLNKSVQGRIDTAKALGLTRKIRKGRRQLRKRKGRTG